MKIVLWEYTTQVFTNPLSVAVVEKFLNECGKEGWELVQSRDIQPNNNGDMRVLFIFKRPTGQIDRKHLE